MLDGGFNAWIAAGFETSQAREAVEPAEFNSNPPPDLHIGYQEIDERLDEGGFIPLDTRGDGEYTGEVVRAARGGAIPGAIHLEYVNNVDENGFFKTADELRTMYERAGVMPEQTVACY